MRKTLMILSCTILLLMFFGCSATQNTDGADADTDGTAAESGSTQAANNGSASGCEHNWGQWVQQAATCEKTGKRERTCKICQFTEQKDIPKTAHKESEWIIASEAKVGVDGRKYKKCVNCDEKLKEMTIPAIGEFHTHSEAERIVVRITDCTKGGKEDIICDCGKVMRTETIPPVEHAMLSKRMEATATEAAYTLRYCANCDYSYKEAIEQTSTLQFQSNGDGTCQIIGLNATAATSVDIPQKSPAGDTVVAIADKVFQKNSVLKSVSFPATLKEIGDYAFQNCTALATVSGSEHITKIGASAFNGCTSLKSIDLSGTSDLKNYILSGCTALTSVRLSANLEKLPQGMFANCSSLKEINLPANLRIVGNGAFQASNIEQIVLPDSVEEIEMYAFRYCSNLKSITFSKNLKKINPLVFERCTALRDAPLPDKLQYLGRLAFTGCTSLTSVTVPNTVTSIGDGCFSGCTSLVSATLSAGVSYLPQNMFYGCTALANVHIPSGIVIIREWAFTNTAITNLVLPDSCEGVGESAFSGCKKLVSVSFGAKFDGIGKNAFRGCAALKEIILPNTLESLGDGAFANCTGLKKIYLGTSITKIGSGAFENCTGLSAIFLPKSLAGISPDTNDKSPFAGCSGTLDIYSDIPQSNQTWERYFGRVICGISYGEYKKITGV